MIKLTLEKEVFIKRHVFDEKENANPKYTHEELLGIIGQKEDVKIETGKSGMFVIGPGIAAEDLENAGLVKFDDFRERIVVSATRYGESVASAPSCMTLTNMGLNKLTRGLDAKAREKVEIDHWGDIVALAMDDKEFFFKPITFDDIFIFASCTLLSVADDRCRIGFGITVYKKTFDVPDTELYVYAQKYAVMNYDISGVDVNAPELPEGLFIPDEIYEAIPTKYKNIMKYAIYDELLSNILNAKEAGNAEYVDGVVENVLETVEDFFSTDIGKKLHPAVEIGKGIKVTTKEKAYEKQNGGKREKRYDKGEPPKKNIFGRTGKERSGFSIPRGKSKPQKSDSEKYLVTLNTGEAGITESYEMNIPSNFTSLRNAYIRNRLSLELHNLNNETKPEAQVALIDPDLIKAVRV